MAYHHRIATLALALALTAGVPAAAAAQQSGQPDSPAPASPCSEVCSGGGYTSATSTTTSPTYSLPIILNDLGNPAPCSEVCSGGGYTSATSTSTSPTYSLPVILNDLGNPAPCSEVCSGGGYGSVSPPSRIPDHSSAPNTATIPPAAVHVAAQSSGFAWGDAGIGAGGMLAVTVVGIGGALTLTRRRNQHIHD